PHDLLEEILCRVPAIYLKPLRSTCKKLSSLFNDKRFRRKHFDKAQKQSLVGVELRRVSISRIFHCDGLLLYINEVETVMVVWNPFMGKTRWIQHIDGDMRGYYSYVLGSYQDKKSGITSYKVLRYWFGNKPVFEICELYSNSWRIFDVTPNFRFYGIALNSCVSLKGKTYWLIC
ncbi:hypothetical protein CARUB_v10016359mg, partial [Capsella rubella]